MEVVERRMEKHILPEPPHMALTLSAWPEALLLQLPLSRLKAVQLHGLALVKMEERPLPVPFQGAPFHLVRSLQLALLSVQIWLSNGLPPVPILGLCQQG